MTYKKVNVRAASGEYEILIGKGASAKIGNIINRSSKAKKILIISDENTNRLFSAQIKNILRGGSYEVDEYVMVPGETSKSLSVYGQILEYASRKQLTRGDVIVGLGGGIVGDMSGFVAGTYLRGIDYYQIPTTLLAAVDSSVGGKTGINLRTGKNLVGVFNQPDGVLCDTDFLKSLDDDVLADGISEMIKYGMICDYDLFERIIYKDFEDGLEDNIKRCVEIKVDIIQKDEFDRGERQLLNFGHTIGHAIEKLSEYKISHGHAVAIGMASITKSAVANGICDQSVESALTAGLKSFSLPVESPFSTDEIWEATISDKKRTGDTINIVLPECIGNCRLYPMKTDDFRYFLKKGLVK